MIRRIEWMSPMKSHVRRYARCLSGAAMLVSCHAALASDKPSHRLAETTAVACPATLAQGASAAAGQRLLGKIAGTLPLSNALVTMNAVNDVPESLSQIAEIGAENDPDDNSDPGIWIAEMSASPTSALPVTLICQYGAIPVGQRVSPATLLLPLPVGKSYACTVKTPHGKDPRRATAECALM